MTHSYRRLLGYALRQRRVLIAILALTLTAALTTALQPWPIKILADYALEGGAIPGWLSATLNAVSLDAGAVTLIVLAAVASLALFLLNSLLGVGLSLCWTLAGQRMVFDLGEDLYESLLRRSLLVHHRQPVGDSLNRLTDDTYCVYTVTEGILISPAQSALRLVTVGGVAWALDPTLTLVTFAIAPLVAASALYFGRRIKRRSRKSREARSRVTTLVHRTLSVIPIVQAFTAEERHGREYEARAADAVAVSQRGTLVQSYFGLVNGLITSIGAAVVLFLGGLRVLEGAMTIGTLLVFLAYLQTVQGSFRGLLGTYRRLKTAEAGMERVFEVLDADEGVRDLPGARALSAAVGEGSPAVSFEGVTFGYEAERPVLHDIDLDVRTGETVAIVGPTGSGKTTLASLIPRFFDPWQGRVRVAGSDVREVSLDSLRAQIALVMQESFLLPLSVAQNIAYARPEASQEEIVAAAVAANASAFIEDLPQGYDTPVGELGATLSGGQKQRLAIARALLKDAPLLILDEPTAALDAETEARLIEALERLMEGRTTIIIAHRLSTIRQADRIVVIESGRVVESGTHADLFAACGSYRRLYDLQTSAVGPGASP